MFLDLLWFLVRSTSWICKIILQEHRVSFRRVQFALLDLSQSDFLPLLSFAISATSTLINLDPKAKLFHCLCNGLATTAVACVALQALAPCLSFSLGSFLCLQLTLKKSSIETKTAAPLVFELIKAAAHVHHWPNVSVIFTRIGCCLRLGSLAVATHSTTTSAIVCAISTLSFAHKTT